MKQYLILSILMCISACGAPISDPVPTPVPNTVSDDCKNTPLFEGYSHTYAFSPDRVTCFVLHVAETHNDMFLPHFLLVSHSNTHGWNEHTRSGLFIFSDPINRHDMNGHDFNPIRGADFINTLDNAFLFWNIAIPETFLHAEQEHPLRKILEFRNQTNYLDKKREFYVTDTIFLETNKELIAPFPQYETYIRDAEIFFQSLLWNDPQ